MHCSEHEHDCERRKHESDPRQHAAPYARALITREDAHLQCRGARQCLHDGKALDEPLLGEPVAPLLDFLLDQAPDRRNAEAKRADLEEHLEDFEAPPVNAWKVCLRFAAHARTPSLVGTEQA